MKNKNGHNFVSKNTVIEQLRGGLSALLNYLKSKQLLEEVISGRNHL